MLFSLILSIITVLILDTSLILATSKSITESILSDPLKYVSNSNIMIFKICTPKQQIPILVWLSVVFILLIIHIISSNKKYQLGVFGEYGNDIIKACVIASILVIITSAASKKLMQVDSIPDDISYIPIFIVFVYLMYGGYKDISCIFKTKRDTVGKVYYSSCSCVTYYILTITFVICMCVKGEIHSFSDILSAIVSACIWYIALFAMLFILIICTAGIIGILYCIGDADTKSDEDASYSWADRYIDNRLLKEEYRNHSDPSYRRILSARAYENDMKYIEDNFDGLTKIGLQSKASSRYYEDMENYLDDE